MAASVRTTRRQLRPSFLVILATAWIAVALLAGCTPEEPAQGLAETPTVPLHASPSTASSPIPVTGPVVAPLLPPEGTQFPDAIVKLLSELELGGEPLVVSESVAIPPLCDTPGSSGQSTWSFARVSVGDAPGDAGFCLLGSLPGTYTDDDGMATIEAAHVLDDGRVRISSAEQLSSIVRDGVVVYTADSERYAVPIYISSPDPQDIKDGIDEGRMIPVPDFCTKARPLLRWLVLDESGDEFELEGDQYLDAVYVDTEILIELEEGEHVAMDWETGNYVWEPSRASTEGLLVGLTPPEPPAMVDVATREEVEAWWQAYGLRDASGKLLQIRIEEERYLDDRGHEVKTFKVVGSGELVWMRVFANVPRHPTGRARLDLAFVEKIPGELAVGFRDADGKPQLASLITLPTAEEERNGRRPILKTDMVAYDPASPPLSVVKPFLWKEGDVHPQETDLECYYEDADELPRSLQDITPRRYLSEFIGRDFGDALASWVPYVDGETLDLILEIAEAEQARGSRLDDVTASAVMYADQETALQIVETWRASVRNEVPLNYVDGEYVPQEYRRDDWGALPHDLVEQALTTVVTAARSDSALDSEERTFLRDLVGGIRTITIRGTYGQGRPYLKDLSYDTYRDSSHTVYLAFYECPDSVSLLRLTTQLYLRSPDTPSKNVVRCVLLARIFHEAEWSRYSGSDQSAENWQEVRTFFLWLMEVFADDFDAATAEVSDYVERQYLPWLDSLARGEVTE